MCCTSSFGEQNLPFHLNVRNRSTRRAGKSWHKSQQEWLSAIRYLIRYTVWRLLITFALFETLQFSHRNTTVRAHTNRERNLFLSFFLSFLLACSRSCSMGFTPLTDRYVCFALVSVIIIHDTAADTCSFCLCLILVLTIPSHTSLDVLFSPKCTCKVILIIINR